MEEKIFLTKFYKLKGRLIFDNDFGYQLVILEGNVQPINEILKEFKNHEVDFIIKDK